MKKRKNYADIIIKITSYTIAIIIVFYTIQNGADSNYQELFIKIGKIVMIATSILLVIWIIYKIIKYRKDKNKTDSRKEQHYD